MLAQQGVLPTAPDWSGDLAVILQALGPDAELVELLADVKTPTGWFKAAAAVAAGEFQRAADHYDRHCCICWERAWCRQTAAMRTRRPCPAPVARHAVGDRWQVDETDVKLAGHWRYVYRAIDSSGRSSTCSSPRAETPRPPVGSSTRPSARPRSRPSRSPPIRRRLPGRVDGAAASGMAPHRPVRQQRGRVRPRQAEGAAGSDARAQAGPQRQGSDRRAWLRAGPTTRPLRARGRRASGSALGDRVRRAGLGDLRPDCAATSLCRRPTRCNSALSITIS
jgi:DDE domain